MNSTALNTKNVAALVALVAWGISIPSALAGTGEQQAFLGKLSNTERSVAAAQVKLGHQNQGIVGVAQALEDHASSLAASSTSLSDADVADLAASGTRASERVTAASAAIADLQADPSLPQFLKPALLAKVESSLVASRASLKTTHTKLNASLILWNTLGSLAEIQESAVGGPGTMTLSGATFVAGTVGGALLIPQHRSDPSEQLRFGDYSITPEGTIELWFMQDGYATVSGQPDDGHFHAFWSPDAYPYDSRGASLLTYQVPGEAWHFDIWDGTQNVRNSIFPNIAPGEWHHVAFTWSSPGSYTEVYFDGVLLNRVEQTFEISTPLNLPMQFGFDWDDSDRGARSVLDNLKIWSKAKTDFSDRY